MSGPGLEGAFGLGNFSGQTGRSIAVLRDVKKSKNRQSNEFLRSSGKEVGFSLMPLSNPSIGLGNGTAEAAYIRAHRSDLFSIYGHNAKHLKWANIFDGPAVPKDHLIITQKEREKLIKKMLPKGLGDRILRNRNLSHPQTPSGPIYQENPTGIPIPVYETPIPTPTGQEGMSPWSKLGITYEQWWAQQNPKVINIQDPVAHEDYLDNPGTETPTTQPHEGWGANLADLLGMDGNNASSSGLILAVVIIGGAAYIFS
jgi:hypothetical protein